MSDRIVVLIAVVGVVILTLSVKAALKRYDRIYWYLYGTGIGAGLLVAAIVVIGNPPNPTVTVDCGVNQITFEGPGDFNVNCTDYPGPGGTDGDPAGPPPTPDGDY